MPRKRRLSNDSKTSSIKTNDSYKTQNRKLGIKLDTESVSESLIHGLKRGNKTKWKIKIKGKIN